jgi:hypothetical protein
VRATIFLKSSTGPKPYKTGFFSKQEFNRLLSDFNQFQKTGLPKHGIYNEDLGTSGEEIIFLDFDEIAEIKKSS